MITIEKNIPAPSGAKVIRFALDQMEIHDSFFLPDATANTRSMLFRLMREHKNDFTSRVDANGGLRVWRLA